PSRHRRRERRALHRVSRPGHRRPSPQRPLAMASVEIKVPDIGDFKDIPVIELLVKPGDAIQKEESLVTLESDKATMEVPSTHAGVVKELRVKIGDKVSQGSVIALVDSAGADATVAKTTPAQAPAPAQVATPAPDNGARGQAPAAAASPSAEDTAALNGAIAPSGARAVRDTVSATLAQLDADLHAEVLVLGAGPG